MLRFAILIPNITAPAGLGKYDAIVPNEPEPPTFPFPGRVPGVADLADPAVVERLKRTYVSPLLAINDWYAQPIPFGTQRNRSAFNVLKQETSAARARLEKVIYGHGPTYMGPEVLAAGRAIDNQRYLDFLQTLDEAFRKRRNMEDSDNPRILKSLSSTAEIRVDTRPITSRS